MGDVGLTPVLSAVLFETSIFFRNLRNVLKTLQPNMAHLGGFENLDFAEIARSQVAQLQAEKAEMMVPPPVQQIQMAGIPHKVSVLGSGAGNIIVNPKAAPEDQPHEIVKIGPKSKMGPKSKLGPKSKMGPKSVIESPASGPPQPSSEPEKEDVSMFPDMNDFFVKSPTMGPKSKKSFMSGNIETSSFSGSLEG